jgi:anti-anti-sigma factor
VRCSLLKIEVERVEDTVTLFCRGRIVCGPETEILEAIAYKERCRCLLVDVEAVSGIDARGLGSLVAIFHWTMKRRIQFAVVNCTEKVRALINLMGLDRFIPTRATVSLVDEPLTATGTGAQPSPFLSAVPC